MLYESFYKSNVGTFRIVADESNLFSLQLAGQKGYIHIENEERLKGNDVTKKVENYLDLYFKGINPKDVPPIKLIGTPFQMDIWNILLSIPYGKRVSYFEIGSIYKNAKGKETSLQAIGTAISKNPILIIVPCHRVINKNGEMGSYSAGSVVKAKLLELEKHNQNI